MMLARWTVPLTLALGASAAGGCGRTVDPPIAPSAPAALETASPAEPAPAAARPTYELEVPERWTRQQAEGFETITGPDGEVHLRIVETRGDDLAEAIAAAWKKASPTMVLKERDRSTGAGNERFSEQLVIGYSDDANTQIAQAVALRHVADPERIYVLLVEGPLKAVQKRGAELSRIVTSIEIEGAAKLRVEAKDRQPFDEARREAFFAFVEEARELSGVPGTAIAVVTPEGVFSRGLGTRALGRDEPVDADTQFMIGSITKSFSTLLLATLVDDGRVSWDAKVKEVYPRFSMADERGEAIQMRHLFCACVGAPRQDMEMLFEFAGKRAEDVFGEVASMKLTTDFGETFQYNNQLTAAGGFIAGRLALGEGRHLPLGRAYQEALRRRVLDPIGMKDTMLLEAKVRARRNHAMPHHLDWTAQTEPVALELERFLVPYAPAGGLWSTAEDMAKYLQLQLARGKNAAGERVVSEASLAKTQTPQVSVSDETGYGMGWLSGKYRGLVAVEHSGGTMGFNSDLVFFPEIGVGLFVVGNRSPAAMHGAVRARLIELLFDLPNKSSERLRHNLAELKRLVAEASQKVADAPVPAELLGRYASKRLGPMTLRKTGEGVVFDVGEWQGRLAPMDPKERKDAYLLTTGPLQGMMLLEQRVDDEPALVLKHSQTDYLFQKR